MIEEQRIKVKVGGRQFLLPVYGDVDNTYYLAKQLHERITRIEEASSRIDTQSFTIEATMEALFEIQRSEDGSKEDTTTMMADLKKLSTRLEDLIREYQLDKKKP